MQTKTSKNGFFGGSRNYFGQRFNKFGADDFAELITRQMYQASSYNVGYLKSDLFSDRLKKYFTNLQMDVAEVSRRQKLYKAMITDQKLIKFLTTTRLPGLIDSRQDRAQWSSSNDDVAIETVGYINKLSELLAKNPAYSGLKKDLKELQEKNQWLKQMEQISENSKKYTKHVISTNLKLTCTDAEAKTKRRFDVLSDYLSVNFVAKDSTIPVFSRLKGRLTIAKSEKEFEPSLDFGNEDVSMLGYSIWESLLRKIIDSKFAKKVVYSTGVDSTLSVEITITITENKKMAAVVKFGDEPVKNLLYLYRKVRKRNSEDSEQVGWVYEDENYEKGKSKLGDYLFNNLEQLKNDYAFNYSRKVIFDNRDNFESLFSELTDLIVLASVARLFSKNTGKWTFPKILPAESGITNIQAGINPLFLFKQKGNAVPNDVAFNEDVTGLILTGVNAGGKTGYTNMIALNQMLLQTGWPVFAKKAEMSMKDNILCHYVETEDIGINLSRYQSELHRLKSIIGEVTSHSLLLFDEPFSGTSSECGTHQAYEVVRVLAKVKSVFVINTHFHKLVEMVESGETPNIINYHFELPNLEQPNKKNYKLLPGGSNLSQGESIALSEKVDFKSMMDELKKRKVLTK